MRTLALLLPTLLLSTGCDSSSGASPADLGSIEDLAPVPDLVTSCTRAPRPADGARKVVVSHPFSDSGGKATDFEVLDLSATGKLSATGTHFAMGPAFNRPLHFTPDGEIGLVAQDDGSIGEVRFDASGAPTVVESAWQGGFYAEDVLITDDGSRAWVLDANTSNNGGGIYEIVIGCDGTLVSRGRVAESSGLFAMELSPKTPSLAIGAATRVLSSAAGNDVHAIDLGGPSGAPKLVGGGNAFGDGQAIASSVAPTGDGLFALVADNGYNVGSRVAVVSTPDIKPIQLLMIPNPAQVLLSPFGNAALVLSSDGMDAIRLLAYDATSSSAPFHIVGEITYVNGRPQLPSVATMITRGRLKGMVLVAENVAVRQVQFTAAGDAKDVGFLAFGDGLTAIAGAIGVQP